MGEYSSIVPSAKKNMRNQEQTFLHRDLAKFEMKHTKAFAADRHFWIGNLKGISEMHGTPGFES